MKIDFTSEAVMEKCVLEILNERVENLDERKDDFFVDISKNSIIMSQVNLCPYGVADIIIITPKHKGNNITKITVIELKNRVIKCRDLEQLSQYMVAIKRCIFEASKESINEEFIVKGCVLGTEDPKIHMSEIVLKNSSISLASITLDSMVGCKIKGHLEKAKWDNIGGDVTRTAFYEKLCVLGENHVKE